MYRSPLNSPYRMSRTNSSRSIGMPSGPSNGQKSPMRQDRFMYKSPSRMNSFHENFMNDFDCHNMGILNTPGTPGTPKSIKPPQITKKHELDAPDVKNDIPLKLIDINDNNEIVIAIANNVYIWRDRQTYTLLNDGDVPIDGVCWVGKDVAISGLGHVELWDVNRTETIQDFYDHQNRAAAMSSYGNFSFATGGDDGVVCKFDLRTNKFNKINAHRGQVCSLSWSPDGSALASGGDDCIAYVYDQKQKVHIKHNAPVHAVAWMKPGLLVTGQSNPQGEISCFNMRSGDRKSESTGASISGICMTEKWGLLVGHDDYSGTWDIWTHDLNRKIAENRSHKDQIINIASNTDGSFVATISADESLILWELNQPILTPSQQSRAVPNQYKSPRSMRSPGCCKSPSSCMPRSPNAYYYRF